MAITLPDFLCEALEDVGDPFALTLPGGLEIQDYNLMKAIQPLLAPLIPLFDIIDTVVAIYNCVKAIPDCLGPPPDPTGLVQCLPTLAEKLMKLLKLIPILSLPITVAHLVDLVIAALREVKEKLQNLVDQMKQIERAIEHGRNLKDAGLTAILACAQGNVQQEATNTGKQLASLGKLLALIGMFMEMIGGPKVPDLAHLNGKALSEVLVPIDDLVTVLMTIRKAIPFPPAAPGASRVL
jgi:hypothetical protein